MATIVQEPLYKAKRAEVESVQQYFSDWRNAVMTAFQRGHFQSLIFAKITNSESQVPPETIAVPDEPIFAAN